MHSDPIPPLFELEGGDRVVFLGSTFVERAQEFGYVELALATRWPARRVTFRNLGWSGDTVYGDSRGHYTNPPTAYEHLVDQVTSAAPTHLFVCYGANLAFEGAAGMDPFLEGLNRLLDDLLENTDAQVVLLSPPPHEPSTSPTDVEAYNDNLEQASTAIREVAERRDLRFIDLFGGLREVMEREDDPLTTNGIYYNAAGYYHTARVVEEGLGLAARGWTLALDAGAGTARASGATVAAHRGDRRGQAFTLTHERLPVPSPTIDPDAEGAAPASGRVVVSGLRGGRYELREEGRAVAVASAREWAAGVAVTPRAAHSRAERIRSLIKEKNRLYFYRYRPQNETYLLGFREYEQGQLVGELDQFDVLVAERELEIDHLRRPEPYRYELVRVP